VNNKTFLAEEDSDAFLTRYHEPKLSRDVSRISFAEKLINYALNLDSIQPLQLIIGGSK
jgi:hypothetical protein